MLAFDATGVFLTRRTTGVAEVVCRIGREVAISCAAGRDDKTTPTTTKNRTLVRAGDIGI